MRLNRYQKLARSSASYPNVGKNLSYPTMGLCGESGEVAEKVKKIFRDCKGKVIPEAREAIGKELGDVLWYLSNLCSELNFELDEVAKINLEKITSRIKRNKVNGTGDNR